MRRSLLILHRQGLVNRISYRPDDYPGFGTLPLACGVAHAGVLWANEECPWTDPKELIRDHSPLTIEHEIKRARFHAKVVAMCQKQKLELFWKKTDLKRTVEPDDVFAIKSAERTAYYFFELENKRKSFRELLAKYRRYDEYYGSDRCRNEWKDFSTFTVVTQIRSEEARQNILRFLSGKPVHVYMSGVRRTIVNPAPILGAMFWFTTDEIVADGVEGQIFETPRDCGERRYGFLA
jgi:hypothetical protein